MRVNENEIITSGIFRENVENHGTIRGGVFEGAVESFGGIEGGEFESFVSAQPHSSINGGEFKGPVEAQANSIIKGGKFYGDFANYGTIRDGKFYGDIRIFGGVEGGEFFGTADALAGSVISNGIFHGDFNQHYRSKIKNAQIDGDMYYVYTLPNGQIYKILKQGKPKPAEYSIKVEKALDKAIELKKAYIDEGNDQSTKNASVDLLGAPQDFNDNII